jgi:ribonuclease R
MAHGSLDLDMPETKILLDPAGYAERLERVEHDESHQLIEEFMLAANEAVARLTRQHKLPSLYRVHDDPEPARLGELRATLADHGISAGDLTERAELGRVLAILATHAQGHTLRTQLLRSLRKAAYRHSPDGHYGLHKKDYTHFTSPIRRYADLVVHRVLERHLTTDKSGAARATRYDLPGVERLAEHLSRTEINSAEAERDSVKVKLMEFFSRQLELSPPTRFTAVITDVRPQGLFIELTESLAFGFLPLEALRDDRYAPTPSGDALIGRRHRRRLGLNDRLEVIVAKVDRYRRQVDFAPAG